MKLAVALLLVAGCTGRTRCGLGSRLELRDGTGALELRIADAAGGGGATSGDLDLCEASGKRVGALAWEGDSLRLLDRDGVERARMTGLDVTTPRGPGPRLYRADRMTRVLDPRGVAYGSIFQQTPSIAIVNDAGGSPIAKVEPRDADVVIAAPDGATRAYVVPSPGLDAAAMFAIEALPVEDRALLAVATARTKFR